MKTILSFIFIALALSACKKDTKENPTNAKPSIVGTWKLQTEVRVSYSKGVATGTTTQNFDYPFLRTFNADLTGSTAVSGNSSPFTYSIDSDTVILDEFFEGGFEDKKPESIKILNNTTLELFLDRKTVGGFTA